jgi:hypothetical protein
MIINVSNHPSAGWSREQFHAARELAECGIVIDIPHPVVDPAASGYVVAQLAWQVLAQIVSARDKHRVETGCTECFVHLVGEAGFVDYLNKLLHLRDIRTVYSTTEREVVEQPDGAKISRFRFVRFREYLAI